MIKHCFPQPIYVSDFDSSQIELDYTTSRRWHSNTISSFGNYNKLTEKSYHFLIKKIADYTNKVIIKSHKIEIGEIWVNEYYEKDFQEQHIHPGYHFSFTIIHKCPEGSGYLKFLNPFAKSLDYAHNNISYRYFYQQFETPPQNENTIIIWPSYITHMVTPGNNKNKRVTYSGNIKIII
jgi:uncharacterized protein (TIGR02466 family)